MVLCGGGRSAYGVDKEPQAIVPGRRRAIGARARCPGRRSRASEWSPACAPERPRPAANGPASRELRITRSLPDAVPPACLTSSLAAATRRTARARAVRTSTRPRAFDPWLTSPRRPPGIATRSWPRQPCRACASRVPASMNRGADQRSFSESRRSMSGCWFVRMSPPEGRSRSTTRPKTALSATARTTALIVLRRPVSPAL
jgi:hypothetical protein